MLIGYIVECHARGAMVLNEGQLYFGKQATLFRTRAKAASAIKRTIKDRRDNFNLDFEQEFGKLLIVGIREAI